MSSIFQGEGTYNSIRPQFFRASFSDINGGTASAPFCLGNFRNLSTVTSIVNNSAAEINLYVLGFKMDPTVAANYKMFLQLGPQQGFNFDQSTAPNLTFPAGCGLYLAKSSGTAVSGDAVRVFSFG